MFRQFAFRATIEFGLAITTFLSLSAAAIAADPAGVPPAPPAAQSDTSSAAQAPNAGPQTDPRLQQIPGLGNMIQPDGSILLPGGAGIIRRDPNHVGVQINTPDGPFEIVVPRRRRTPRNADMPPAPGSDTDAPSFGSPPAPGSGRLGNRDRLPPRGRLGGAPNNNEALEDRRALHEYAVTARIFHARNYPAVLRRLDRDLERDPGDQNLLQLRSLVFFTMHDYRAAYRDAHTALAADDVWDWPTLRSLYHPGEYTAHYRALEETAAANPNAPELWFLLGYHNRMLGNSAASKEQFQRVAALDPGNELARRLATGQTSASLSEAPPMPSAAAPVVRGGHVDESKKPQQPSPGYSTPPQRTGPISVDLGKPAPTSSLSGPELKTPGPSSGK